MSPYNIMVVDDSAFMRKLLKNIIEDDPEFTVVYAAKDGQEAVEKALELKPDVITMDIEMPKMNGLDAIREILKSRTIPIIMVSSATETGTNETIRGLELGALDFIKKPSGSISLDLHKEKDKLLEKLKLAVHNRESLRLATATRAGFKNLPPYEPKHKVSGSARENNLQYTDIVAVGTSTGGPKALLQLIGALPENFPAPVLVVQHMPAQFTKSLAQRLNLMSKLHVKEAEDGEQPLPGCVYVAPGDWHMVLDRDKGQYILHLSQTEPIGGHRPSVDVLFESLAEMKELRRHLVLMTGMGMDGAKGMRLVRESGAVSTIAESEETCVVYGMPRAAVENGAAMFKVRLENIAGKLTQVVKEADT